VRSKTYKLNVIDLPSVKRIKVTYHFPSWSGLKDAIEDPGGDLRAVEGTTAEVSIVTDRPLANGVILLDDDTRIPIRDGVARVPIQKDGLYHIASVERGAEHGIGQNEDVRLTDDYFIEARKDNPPTVRIRRPGHDAKANPVEEVTVEVEAEDDFGLRGVDLVYSVNGGPEKALPMLKGKEQKTAEGKTVLSLEDFKLVPGDVVTMYAIAKDARNESRTDMFFVEAQPFEREYSQSQQGGGGGGGGDQEADQGISKRQKEIIAATFNQLKDKKSDKTAAAEAGKFLSEVQSKLRDQAKSLSNRMKSRELAGTNAEFQQFAKDMDTAVEAMGPATEKLHGQQWRDALAPEQKALQYLLRAEAVFRQIQVAFGQRGGGGGGGGAGRDLDNLFDLELDTEKNQYESGQQSASEDQRKKEIDEALQKLEQLAKRQQELAEQQRQNPQTPQQRWQQEMLRREAEQLQHKMEQLSRQGNQQQGQQQQGKQQQSGQSQPGQGGPGGQLGQQGQQQQQQSMQGGPGQQSQQQQRGQRQQQQQQQAMQQSMRQRMGQSAAGQQQLEQAIERLKQATHDMENAASSQQSNSPQGEAEARRAAERLQEARDIVNGMRQQQGGEQIGDLARKAEDLAGKHQDFGNRLRKEFGSEQSRVTPDKAGQLAGEAESMLKQLKELEKALQQAARDLAATDRDASNKVRRALGDMQQDELSRNLGMSAEAIRRGYGAWAAMREATTTQSLNKLRDRLKELEAAGVKGGKAGDKGLEQALAEAENMRRQMEQVTRGMGQDRKGGQPGERQGQGQPGQQQGQGQPGQMGQGGRQGQEGQQQSGQAPGQQQGQQPGQQSGQSQAQSQSSGGQSGGGQQFGPGADNAGGDRQAGPAYGGTTGAWGGRNYGDRWNGGGWRVGDPAIAEQTYRETLRDLNRLRDQVGANPDIARDVNDLIRQMQRVDPRRFGQEPLLAERINSQVVSSLEQIELLLRRKVEEQQGGNVRSGASEPPPPGYANSVADYFRKLSKESSAK
jgi:hypothetical protein